MTENGYEDETAIRKIDSGQWNMLAYPILILVDVAQRRWFVAIGDEENYAICWIDRIDDIDGATAIDQYDVFNLKEIYSLSTETRMKHRHQISSVRRELTSFICSL